MALVMTSHHTCDPPPLPSRGGSNVTHVTIGYSAAPNQSRQAYHHAGRGPSVENPPPVSATQSRTNKQAGRSVSVEAPPPVPPMNFNKRRNASDHLSREHNSNPPLPSRGHSSNPPLPSRGHSSNQPQPSRSHQHTPSQAEPNPLSRKSYETKSFVNRHTATAYSDPASFKQHPDKVSSHSDRPLPSLPQSDTTSRQTGKHNRPDIYEPDIPQELPPSRPSKESFGSPVFNDFEKRFFFHDTSDFPSPEPVEKEKKAYPSRSTSVRNKTPPQLGGHKSLGSL